MSNRKELLYYFIVVSKYAAFLLFIIGIIVNYDGLSILIHSNDYHSGQLKVNDFPNGPSDAGPGVTIRASGVVEDGTNTGLILGNDDNKYVDSILNRYAQKQEVLLPIWYKSDGKLTFDRYEHEESFPFWRIMKKVITFLTVFNVPLIVLIILQRRLKKKYKIEEK